MAAARFALFAILWFSASANAQTNTLVVYSANPAALDSLTTHSLKTELQRVLSPAGIALSWQDSSNGVEEEPAAIVVGHFEGKCSVEQVSLQGADPRQPVVLAESAISNDRILPYFRVSCADVFRTLAPVLQHLSVPVRSEVFGRALARVIAHEIYHIAAQTREHEATGLAKAALSRQDLLTAEFGLSTASLHRMRAAGRSPHPSTPLAALVP